MYAGQVAHIECFSVCFCYCWYWCSHAPKQYLLNALSERKIRTIFLAISMSAQNMEIFDNKSRDDDYVEVRLKWILRPNRATPIKKQRIQKIATPICCTSINQQWQWQRLWQPLNMFDHSVKWMCTMNWSMRTFTQQLPRFHLTFNLVVEQQQYLGTTATLRANYNCFTISSYVCLTSSFLIHTTNGVSCRASHRPGFNSNYKWTAPHFIVRGVCVCAHSIEKRCKCKMCVASLIFDCHFSYTFPLLHFITILSTMQFFTCTFQNRKMFICAHAGKIKIIPGENNEATRKNN